MDNKILPPLPAYDMPYKITLQRHVIAMLIFEPGYKVLAQKLLKTQMFDKKEAQWFDAIMTSEYSTAAEAFQKLQINKIHHAVMSEYYINSPGCYPLQAFFILYQTYIRIELTVILNKYKDSAVAAECLEYLNTETDELKALNTVAAYLQSVDHAALAEISEISADLEEVSQNIQNTMELSLLLKKAGILVSCLKIQDKENHIRNIENLILACLEIS
jgi:hypothetical protein